MKTIVINLRDASPGTEFVYIGRFARHRLYGALPRSKWANPYHLPRREQPGDRDRVIARFRDEHLAAHPELVAAVRAELAGKTLGCWCRPVEGFQGLVLCHGQILAALADGCSPEEID